MMKTLTIQTNNGSFIQHGIVVAVETKRTCQGRPQYRIISEEYPVDYSSIHMDDYEGQTKYSCIGKYVDMMQEENIVIKWHRNSGTKFGTVILIAKPS